MIMRTAIIHHPAYARHDTGPGHPESPERYSVVNAALEGAEFEGGGVSFLRAREISKGIIQAAHTKQHYRRVSSAFGEGLEALDGDTMISMHSFEAAVLASGGVCSAIDAVIDGKAANAFVAARPPGHHATAERAMGFCLFNNVAVGARYAQNRYKNVDRVAVIDWDVHHGNGTQGIFFNDPSVFYFSIHQYPWYPGTGSRGESGYGRGVGYTLNIPVKAETAGETQKGMFESALDDIRKRFRPDLIIISAGFDAHTADPLGLLRLVDEDFASMTKSVREWADEVCEGRVVSSLEGGYNLDTLGNTVVSHVSALCS